MHFLRCKFAEMKYNKDDQRRRSKRRQHLPKIRTFKKFGQIFFWKVFGTDRQTDIVVHREVT